MSDTRRRRKSEQSGLSEDLSGSYDELNITKETQSSEPAENHRDSEYDTAGSDGESDGGSQDGVQRESGDGQEEDKPQKKLDDDEDRRNPQYIPKRGTFYEHDDRMTEELAADAVEQPPERETKEKKVWKDKEDRWNHDRYNDDEQAPKSHEELVAVYGYDIRNEEGPPRARRRRRYGRGPNKYTRNWEDEDAYGKTAGSIPTTKQQNRKSNKTGEEFPALGGTMDAPDHVDEPVISSAWYSNKNKTQQKQQNFPPLQLQSDNQKIKSIAINTLTNENKAPNEPTNPAWKKEAKYTTSLSPNRNSSSEVEKTIVKPQIHGNKRQVQESVSLAASRARGRGFKPNSNNNMVTNRTDSKPKGRGSGLIIGDRRNNTNHDEEQLANEIKHMNVHDGSYHQSARQPNKNFYARPNAAPPRMQQPLPSQQPQQPQPSHTQPPDVAGNRPKRYSSLRQRPTIAEGPGAPPYPAQHPQPHGQHGFYTAQGGNSHAVLESQGFPQGHFEPSTPVPPTATPMAAPPVIPITAGQAAPYAPPPFLVPPPQFIPTQTAPPNIINYVTAPNGAGYQPNFQAYSGYNPTVPPQGPPPPPELFQPQGCTYYSPAQQPHQQVQVAPVRRAKAAIPILPPPDNNQHYQVKGRTRMVSQPLQGTLPGSNQSTTEPVTQNEQPIHYNEPEIPSEPLVISETTSTEPIDITETTESNSEILTPAIEPEIVEKIEILDTPVPVEPVVVEESATNVEPSRDIDDTVETKILPIVEEIKELIPVVTEVAEVLSEAINEPQVVESEKIIEPAVEEIKQLTPAVEPEVKKEEIQVDNVIVTNSDALTDDTVVKNVEIDAKVTIAEPEITKVETVVHENPVVEEAAA